MKRYQLAAAARLDLLQIWNYVCAHASDEVADRVLRDIERAIERVVRTPSLGRTRPDLTDLPLRFYRVHNYLVAYDPAARPLAVARVVHGMRDLPGVFRRV